MICGVAISEWASQAKDDYERQARQLAWLDGQKPASKRQVCMSEHVCYRGPSIHALAHVLLDGACASEQYTEILAYCRRYQAILCLCAIIHAVEAHSSSN